MDSVQLTIDAFNRLAQAYQDKFMDLDLYDSTYDEFCDLLKTESPQILELGCGPGNITRYLLKRIPGSKILATDLAPNMVVLTKKNNPDAECEIMDCRKIDTLNKKFDGIVGGFCLPYLSKEEAVQFIKNASISLNKNGVLYFSIMEDNYSKSGIETTSDGLQKFQVYYHEADYLTTALEENGLKLKSLKRIEFPASLKVVPTNAIFIAVK